MANVTKNIGYKVTKEVSPISLVLTPELVQVKSGDPVIFTTQGSASYDNSPITVTWELLVPVGSHIDNVEISADTLEARLFPDVNGMYKVNATATNGSGAEVTKSAYVAVTSSNTKLRREKLNTHYIGESVGSFWKLINNKEVIESLWQEYAKCLSGDYRKAAEVVLSKSIDTIQPGREIYNYILNTELDVSQFDHTLTVVPSFYGTKTATTSIKNFLFKAIVLDASTVLLLDYGQTGIVSTIDTKLHVYDSNPDLSGQYTVKSFIGNTVKLLHSTPILSATKLATASVSAVETETTYTSSRSFSVGEYFLYKGDIVKVTVASVAGVFSGDKRASKTETVSVDVHTTTIMSIDSVELGLSNTVFVPAAEVGGYNKFLKTSTTISLTFSDKNTVLVPDNMGLNDVGSTLVIAGSKFSGSKAKIVNINYDTAANATVFTIYPSLPIPLNAFEESLTLRCTIKKDISIKNTVLTCGGVSGLIRTVTYFADYTNKQYACIHLSEKVLPASNSNLDWRVSSTIKSSSLVNSINYYKEGVRHGDSFYLTLSTSITDKRSSIGCSVVGSYKNYIGFEPTVEPLIDTTGLLLSPEIEDLDLFRIFTELQIPLASKRSDSTIQFSSLAKVLKNSIGITLKSLYYTTINLETYSPVNTNQSNTIYVSESNIDSTLARLGLTLEVITRNTTFPVKITEPIASIPFLSEYIYAKQTSAVEESDNLAVLHKDGSISMRERPEQVLVENIAFFIKNNTEYSGTTLKKGKGLLLEDLNGFFTERGVNSGDLITIDNVAYVIKSVFSNTSIEVLADTNTELLSKAEFSLKSYNIRQKNSYAFPYIQFAANLYYPKNTAPARLIAPSVTVDNIRQIQNNFGMLVGYKIEDFLDYSSPQMSYLNAIKGLMYVVSHGPTVKNIQLATAILLNLPIAQTTSIIEEIDFVQGRIALQPVDEITLEPLLESANFYTFSTKETVTPFTSIAKHPTTGQPYKVGDIVKKFSPLTQKVYVEDYVSGPYISLDQFHKWKILVDVNSISSRDLPHLANFYKQAKPIHTLNTLELVLFLVTTVEIRMSLRLEGTMFLIDDPALGLELTHSFDATNNSGQILRLTDKGELSTRTLFLGKDLKFTATNEVTSNRGGFLLTDPSLVTNDTGIAVTSDVKELPASAPFSGIHFVKGRTLIKSGDILRVYTGINAGVYTITQVTSESTLLITPLTGYGIYTHTPQVSTDSATFGVYRLVETVIAENVECTAVNGTESTFSGISFNWDGVSVGDRLVLNTDHTVQHEITDIEYDPITEDFSSKVITDVAPVVGNTYFVFRPLLVSKDYASGPVTGYSYADPRHIVHALTNQYAIEVGDSFVTTSGSSEQRSVITKVGNGSFEIADLLTGLGNNNTTFKLQKLGRPLEENSDDRLELLHGYDDVSISLTSASAIAGILVLPALPSGLEQRKISGLTSLPEPCDKIYLYDSTNTLVFEGTVSHNIASSAICFMEQDTVADYNIQYKIRIDRRSKA